MVKGREGREADVRQNLYENLEPDIIKTRPYSGHNHLGRAIHKPNMSQTCYFGSGRLSQTQFGYVSHS